MSKIYSNKILKVARTWLGTNFHYYGRIKKNQYNKGGVDCIGLIIKIGEEINSTYNKINIINFDNLSYSKFPNKNELKNKLDLLFIKINKNELQYGDLIYFNFNNNLEHIGIYSDFGLVHCYAEAKKVAEHNLSQYWVDKAIQYYRYPNF